MPRFAPYALYALFALYFCWPLFDEPLALGIYDWDQHLFYYGVVLKNLVEYGQMPFWNPWYCGGNVMWQNPQVAILSPAYALALVMPLQLAMKINIVLHYWIGFAGMHRLLTRVIGLAFLPAVMFIATLVTASGAPAIHLRAGHSVFLPGFYLPFQLYFFFTAFKTGELKYVWLAAMTLALMIFNGGTHILPMSVAALGSFALFAAIGRRDWRPLALVVLFGLAGIAYSAPKLLPVAGFVTGEQFWDTRNPIEKPDLVTRDVLRQTYLVPTQQVGSRLPMQRHGWHEYGNYIGIGSAIALLAGLLFVIVRRSPLNHWFGVSLALTTVAMFLLSLGEFSPYAPAVLSERLPLFSSFRIPSRYTIPFLQFAAIALAWALQSMGSGLFSKRSRSGNALRLAATVVCLVASAHLMYVNRWNLRGVFSEPPFDTSFHWMAGPAEIATDQVTSPYIPGSPMFRALVENRAFYHCYESLQLLRAADPEKPRLFVEGPARVTDVTFSPNRLEFNVFGGPEPARLLLNANWAPGWTSTAGPVEPGGRAKMPSVTIAPGQTGRYAISFVPPWLATGTMLLAIAGVTTALTWRRRFRAIWSARLSPSGYGAAGCQVVYYAAETEVRMAVRRRRVLLGLTVTALAAAVISGQTPAFDVLIRGGQVLDGTGAAAVRADVGIRGDRIAAVGRLDGATATRTIDATGLIVAPGFIDLHTHSETPLVADGTAQSKVRQGVTLDITGESTSPAPRDGLPAEGGEAPDWTTFTGYFERLERQGISMNTIAHVASEQVRRVVMGYDTRAASPQELSQMTQLVARSMEEGAWGLVTRFESGGPAHPGEILAMAKTVAKYGGNYTSHIGSEGFEQTKEIAFAIRVAEEAKIPVHIFHFKIRGKENEGTIGRYIKQIEDARARGLGITANQYPYTAMFHGWSAFFPLWIREGGPQQFAARLKDPALRARLKTDKDFITWAREHGWWDGIVLARARTEKNRQYEGKTIAQIARMRGEEDPMETCITLMAEEGGSISGIFHTMAEADVRTVMRLPWVSIASDGAAINLDAPGVPHPRNYSTNARVLGHYARDQKVLTLPEAVRKMTSLPASILGLADRGQVKTGLAADLAVFDPARVAETNSFEKPKSYAVGVPYVLVNGVVVIDRGQHTGAKPGKALRGPGAARARSSAGRR